MLNADFWNSPDCHVAVNPHQVETAAGLAAWAAAQSWQGLCFFQTSGSEGHPKWVALSKQAFLISAAAVNAHLAVTAADRWLIALPLHHVGGFAILARAYLSGSSVMQEVSRWQPMTFVETCQRQAITLVSLVPTQVHDLVTQQLACPAGLRVAIIGGGGMSPALAAAARSLGWPVFQSYGMTEAGSQIATRPWHEPQAAPGDDWLEVLPHWQTQVDAESRLALRGPALAQGYAQSQTDGQWSWLPMGESLTTRDRVELQTAGGRQWLRFVGRESGFIKILGELVHLAPLQARLDALALQQKRAQMPVIVALPDTRRESRLVLVSEEAEVAEVAEVITAFNAEMPAFLHLSEVIHLPQIPRSPLGKVNHPALAALITSAACKPF